MHSMTTNDKRFCENYEKFRPDYRPVTNMTQRGYKQPPIGQIWELEVAIRIGERIGA